MKVRLGGSKLYNEIVIESEYEEKEIIKNRLTWANWDKMNSVWRTHLGQYKILKELQQEPDVDVEIHPAVKNKYEKRYFYTVDELNLDFFNDEYDLFEFQEPLARELASREGFGSFVSMGLGKTVISIAAMLHHISENDARRCLVVVPASLRRQWCEEIHDFTNDEFPDPILIRGSNYYRVHEDGEMEKLGYSLDEMYRKAPSRIFVTSYSTLSSEYRKAEKEDNLRLHQLDWDIVTLDEASYIKNKDSQRTKAAKEIPAEYRWTLTGTPIETSIENIYNIVDFYDKNYLGSYWQFRSRFLKTEQKKFGGRHSKPVTVVVGHQPGAVKKIKDIMQPIFHRKRKEEVLDDLPDLSVQTRSVGMGGTQARVHTVLMDEMRRRIDEGEKMGGFVTYAQMVCNSTVLLNRSENFTQRYKEWFGHVNMDIDERLQIGEASKKNIKRIPDLPFDAEEPKIIELKAVLHSAAEEGRQVLAFSKHSTFVERISEELEDTDYKFATLTGDDDEDRRNEIVKASERGEIDCIIATEIFNMGVNLQWFDIIVNIDLPWNPAQLNQRIDRIRRIGRKNPVLCINIVSDGSIEQRVLQKLNERQNLFNSFFEEEREITPLDENELAVEILSEDIWW